jgi:hypothetical protein
MTARKGKPEQNSPSEKSKTGQEDDGVVCQEGIPGHDLRDRRARADFAMI